MRGFLLNFVVNPAFKLAVGRLPESAAAPCSQPTMSYGPEFASKELDLWAFMRDVTLDFSRPGKPTDNAFAEFFNAKFRAECLNASWFLSLDEARRSCEA